MLRKRKQEELESGGLLSFLKVTATSIFKPKYYLFISLFQNMLISLKVKFFEKMQGEKFEGNKVSDAEAEQKLEEVKNGMLMAFNYAQGKKMVP